METSQPRQLLEKYAAKDTSQSGPEKCGNAQSGESRPRGPMSAYACFVQECREERQKTHPDEKMLLVDFFKKCGERWKRMNDQERQRFRELAQKEVKRYEEEMAFFNGNIPARVEKPAKKRVPRKRAPQRAFSAFFLFCNDERPKINAEMPEATLGEMAQELDRRWSEGSQKVRDKYEALAAEDKERYEREVNAKKRKESKAKEDKAKEDDAGDERSRTTSAFALFVQICHAEYNRKIPDKPVLLAHLARKCAERWKTMKHREKKHFKKWAKRNKRHYANEMAKRSRPGKGKNAKKNCNENLNPPQQQLSPFLWFCLDYRVKLEAEMPNATVLDVSQELGRRWESCSQEVKDEYEAISARNKVSYVKELEAYRRKYKVEN